MKQLVIIVPLMDQPELVSADTILEAKDEVKTYIGQRLIEDEPEELPGLVLKSSLTEEDMKYLSSKLKAVGIVFVNVNQGSICEDYMLCTHVINKK